MSASLGSNAGSMHAMPDKAPVTGPRCSFLRASAGSLRRLPGFPEC